MKYRLRSGPGIPSRNGPTRRDEHPPGGSTLITSAPISANIRPHSEARSSVRSNTRYPAIGAPTACTQAAFSNSHPATTSLLV